MQTAVDWKPDEITAIPALLQLPGIRGRTAAADATHAQRTVSEAVKADGNECIPALKGNQGKLHEDMKRHIENNPGNIENIQFSKTHNGDRTRPGRNAGEPPSAMMPAG